MDKTRGFVTIATGDERYYILARNLLYSYRQFASVKYPFAIICDKKNKYTAEFDDVILLKKAHCNYLDKLYLYNWLPYDETIFIDADSLAYGDLDTWWKLFEGADDFSLFGYAWTDLKSGRGWFIPGGLNEYNDYVSFIPDFNGGVYYLRKSERCEAVFKLANYFAENYKDYSFTDFKTPADEPCLALAMAVYNCMPLDLPEFVFAPPMRKINADISIPQAHFYREQGKDYDVKMIHFGNYKTRQSFYRFESEKLIHIKEGKNVGMIYTILYKKRLRLFILRFGDIEVFLNRVWRKIRRTLNSQRGQRCL